MKSNKLTQLLSLSSASVGWKEKLVSSEESMVWVQGRGKGWRSMELHAQPPMVALRQARMSSQGNLVFHDLLRLCSFGLLGELGPTPLQHNRPTRTCVGVSDCYRRSDSWKVLPLEKKISLEFSDERNLSDEVLHIPATLIRLDPLSC